MKLKTLKDLKGFTGFGYSEETLKKEAIKWIKQHNEDGWDYLAFVNDWIIEFFNITEEDLK